MDSANDKVVRILLVEDDEVDVMAVKRALRKTQVPTILFVANDGLDALELMRGTETADRVKLPYLILLDLNLPRMGGLEFLDAIRADPELAESVVFVHTTSADRHEREAAYKHNVAGYVLKKDEGENYTDRLVRMLADYWRLVTLPGM